MRHVSDKGHHADHQKWGGFSQGLGHADDGAGHHSRHGKGQDMVEDCLHPGSAYTKGRLSNRGRNRFKRCSGGDNNSRQRHQGKHQTADQRGRSGQIEKIKEYRQPQQSENNRRNGGQIVDINLNTIGPPVARGKFFKINCGRHPDGKGKSQGDNQGKEGPCNSAMDTGQFRLSGISGNKKSCVEFFFQSAPID